MRNYGIPYMGSKTKIAAKIINVLPGGKRFVDLFGGGFAMSHAALLSGKYDEVIYCDKNPIVTHLVEDAINGKYNFKVFKPEFVTREQFEKEKDKNGYIACIWSFGNNGKDYLFGKEIEALKNKAHDFVVFGKHDKALDEIAPGILKAVKSSNIHKRRLEFCSCVINSRKRFDLEHLRCLERLQQLERLERLQQLTIKHGHDYRDYEYRDGDVVYCDPPYVGTAEYADKFNYEEFFTWAGKAGFEMYFSNYPLYDKRFKLIWASELRSSLGNNNNSINFECLYINNKDG